ncbi:hypothetical protein LJK88_44600 [Paenibacillus sp. P26]|nr:hypothetical protein LJK88_44600 [Paenibacillus sp. P26]
MAASGFLLIGAYFLAMFLMRGQQRSWLYFGLCCSAVSVYLVTHGEKIAAMLVPDIPYELFWKIQVLSGLVSRNISAAVHEAFFSERV